jgi:hypothetical protein
MRAATAAATFPADSVLQSLIVSMFSLLSLFAGVERETCQAAKINSAVQLQWVDWLLADHVQGSIIEQAETLSQVQHLRNARLSLSQAACLCVLASALSGFVQPPENAHYSGIQEHVCVAVKVVIDCWQGGGDDWVEAVPETRPK